MTQLNGKINHITPEDIDGLLETGHLNAYQRAATKSAIYPGQGTMLGLSYCLHKLAGEAGEANEHFGKAQRDDMLFTLINSRPIIGSTSEDDCVLVSITIRNLTEMRRINLIKEVGDVLWYLSAICNELGISLQEAAVMNLEKLASRQARDTQRGEGDDR